MDLTFVLFLALGTILMFPAMIYCGNKYGFPFWKTVLATVLLTVFGLISVKIMFAIENKGKVDGLSFFGAVLFIPLWFLLIAKVLKLPYAKLMDAVAPSICIMSALMKVQCMATGCCKGKFLYFLEDETPVYFPSRESELALAIIIGLVLILLIKKGKRTGAVYPIFMILYGTGRFILNWFRHTYKNFVWIFPAGNFWGLISVVVGVVWLIISTNKKRKTNTNGI